MLTMDCLLIARCTTAVQRLERLDMDAGHAVFNDELLNTRSQRTSNSNIRSETEKWGQVAKGNKIRAD